MLARLLRLPAPDRRLLAEAALLVAALRAALPVLPFAIVRRGLEFAARRRAARPWASPARIAWAVDATSRRLPGTVCLVRALAADILLRRHGWPARLRLGVRRVAPSALAAHAWVECEGQIVVGSAPVEGFTLLDGRT